MKKFTEFIKKFFLIDDSPHKIAAGAALGIFWGIMPGEGYATTLVTSTIFRMNRLSAMAGVIATNMWSTFVVMPLAAITGGFLFKENPKTLISNFEKTFHLGWKNFFSESIFTDLLLPLIVGFIVVSVVISLAFYFLLYLLLKYHRLRFK